MFIRRFPAQSAVTLLRENFLATFRTESIKVSLLSIRALSLARVT